MAGKKVGSDGQIRKTTAEWAVDTDTYPEGMRLMDTTDGTVRVSKGTTYALAWTAATGGATAWGAITGTLSDQTDLQQILETQANAIGAVSDSIPLRYKWIGDGGAATGTIGVNTFPMAVTVTNPAAGTYRFVPASGTPWTVGKTTASIASVDPSAALAWRISNLADAQIEFVIYASTDGTNTDPAQYIVIIETEP
jgi:hypothetical protein